MPLLSRGLFDAKNLRESAEAASPAPSLTWLPPIRRDRSTGCVLYLGYNNWFFQTAR